MSEPTTKPPIDLAFPSEARPRPGQGLFAATVLYKNSAEVVVHDNSCARFAVHGHELPWYSLGSSPRKHTAKLLSGEEPASRHGLLAIWSEPGDKVVISDNPSPVGERGAL